MAGQISERIYTMKEVVELLRISDESIVRSVKKGDLAAIKCGHLWRFTETQLNDWLEARTVQALKRKKLIIK